MKGCFTIPEFAELLGISRWKAEGLLKRAGIKFVRSVSRGTGKRKGRRYITLAELRSKCSDLTETVALMQRIEELQERDAEMTERWERG